MASNSSGSRNTRNSSSQAEREQRKKTMITRFISGVGVAVVMLALVWAGGLVTTLSFCLISMIADSEMLRATGVTRRQSIFDLICWMATLAFYLLIYFRADNVFLIMAVLLYLIILMLVFVLTYPRFEARQLIYSFFAFIYSTVTLSCACMTRLITLEGESGFLTTGFFCVWMIFLSAWASDTCAYFVGVAIGRHKITPRLSPKKTVEGCLGGVIGSGLVGLLYGAVLTWTGHGQFGNPWQFMFLGLCGSICGQIGDLAASGIKRSFGIKDFGKCIPGHGGILDRFDSVIFTAPLIYLLTLVVIR